VTDVVEAPSRGWRALPSWARLGIIALAAIVLALVAVVAIRVATRVPPIPTGITPAAELRVGSCLAEDGADAAEYTVVPCGVAHPQQVFATADLDLDPTVYGLVGASIGTFGDAVCDKFLEYRLYLRPGLVTSDYTASAIAVPTADQYAAGDTEALCVILANEGTSSEDLYRPAP
jgi:hypothetical protein